MDLSESIFWMNGRLATDCVEISEDPTSLEMEGFWVALQSFEGKFMCARFATVIESQLPAKDWSKISSGWNSSQTQNAFEKNVIEIKLAKKIELIILLRSEMLAKRQTPRYKPTK